MRASHTSPTPTYTSSDPAPSWKSPDGVSSLYLGDALELLAQVPDDSIDCIWTDPPYLLSNDGITCVGGRMVSVNKGDWDRSQGLEADHEFNVTWTAEAFRVLKPTGTIWVSGTLHVYPSVGMALRQNGFQAAERHRLGKDESAAEPGTSHFHALDGSGAVGEQGRKGQ